MKRSKSYSTKNRRGFLLDTHIFIWWMEKSKQLSKNLYDTINHPQNSIFLSSASIWEMVLKRRKGKFKIEMDLEKGITSSGFTTLPIEVSHVLGIEELPNHHEDPFDRLLIAQSLIENLTLITHDKKIWQYNINVLKT